jgi:hypothetical protein
MADRWEYGLVLWSEPSELHRGPMLEHEAWNWLAEFERDGGRVGAFRVVRRQVGEWKRVEQSGRACNCDSWVPDSPTITHCFFHHENEPIGPASVVCGECFHAYADEAEMKRIEMQRWPDSDPDREVLSCPYCIHDL